jgi:hypothetical protein
LCYFVRNGGHFELEKETEGWRGFSCNRVSWPKMKTRPRSTKKKEKKKTRPHKDMRHKETISGSSI